jgi:hypothetical protein
MKDLSALFKEEANAPLGFTDKVFASIDREAERLARRDRIVWGTISAVSITAATFSGMYALEAWAASSFNSYFSLIFSDMSSLSLWWRELGMSLLESFPIVGVILFLGSLFFVLWSIRKFMRPNGIPFITRIA